MVIVERIIAGGVPSLHVVKEELKNEQTPFVLFVHGFTSAKEHNLHYAYLLAEKGARVVLPEALYHGERSESMPPMELNVRFWDIVMNTIHELKAIKDFFLNEGLIDESRIGVSGTSMGGIVTLGALTQYQWITAGVSLMGSPHYVHFLRKQVDYLRDAGHVLPISDEDLEAKMQSLEPFDLSLHKESLNERPLLFWHGEKDQVVPFKPTWAFYEDIRSAYEANPDNIQFIRDPNADHKVSREGLLGLVNWFETHLSLSTRV
ncbi:prolyl oligopeptidase family serine peptidase [Bacillus sp. SJS]|uniref:prolyl oligopeptidase family serine peptidase n=1 Tax=Bacillus sp. SJS TaxID=1423321 RepID=UPI0004DD0E66|nr:prolyl oligopeptidase family serine peptidase [Bacillus sp. SJS]KZZ84612.1 esterase [Bacillus sp. SJS]